MEDLFDMLESLCALLVIVIPLLLKKKNKKQARPGKKPSANEKPPKALEQTLAEVEKKLEKWAESVNEDEPSAPEAVQTQLPVDTHAMQPERLVAERLQETGMAEGESRTDGFGCIGGSLAHPADGHHQGEDFHSHDAHTLRRSPADEPAVERVKPAVSAADLRRAVVWKEILDAPVSLRES